MHRRTFDAIVVGLGAMGSAAAYHLVARGQRVLGLEQFAPGHTFGSSHGESRIIRKAYFEHPDYVPLLHRAYELWERLERDSREALLRLTGGVYGGPPDGELVAGSLRAAQQHGLAHTLFDAAAARRRFPAFQVADGDVALYEAGAGILAPERCIEMHLNLAGAAGAVLRFQEPVLGWEAGSDSVVVRTSTGHYEAGRLVLTAGAWLGRLLAELALPLQPERIPVFWLQPRDQGDLFDAGRFPLYIWETPGLGLYYGFPHLDRPGAKVGRHHSGVWVDPDTVERQTTPTDEAPVRAFVRRVLPGLDGPVASSAVCLYTLTPDGHFVVDRHPQHSAVLFAGGFSGHGFKFAPVIGEILADLALHNRATPAADFLRIERLVGGGMADSGSGVN